MDFSRAIELIQKSKHVGFALPKELNHDIGASAEALIHFLSSRALYVGNIGHSTLLTDPRNSALPRLASLGPMIKESIISLDTASAPITQLRYEQKDNRVDIILSPSSPASPQHHLSFRDGDAQMDCIISLTVPEEEIDNTQHAPIIFLSTASSRASDKIISLIDTSLSSLSELVFKLLISVEDFTQSTDIATLLLSGILHRTDGLTHLSGANTLLSCHELIQRGADYEAALALSQTSSPLSLTALIGRALARSKKDEKEKISWSLITHDDIAATGRSVRDIDAVLARLVREFPDMATHVLLWQQPDTDDINAYIAGSPALLTSLHNIGNSTMNNTYLHINRTYNSFPQAEQAIRDLFASTKN